MTVDKYTYPYREEENMSYFDELVRSRALARIARDAAREEARTTRNQQQLLREEAAHLRNTLSQLVPAARRNYRAGKSMRAYCKIGSVPSWHEAQLAEFVGDAARVTSLSAYYLDDDAFERKFGVKLENTRLAAILNEFEGLLPPGWESDSTSSEYSNTPYNVTIIGEWSVYMVGR